MSSNPFNLINQRGQIQGGELSRLQQEAAAARQLSLTPMSMQTQGGTVIVPPAPSSGGSSSPIEFGCSLSVSSQTLTWGGGGIFLEFATPPAGNNGIFYTYSNGWFNPSFPTQVTVPAFRTGRGKYLIQGALQFPPETTSYQCGIGVSSQYGGDSFDIVNFGNVLGNSNLIPGTLRFSAVRTLATGDVLNMFAFQFVSGFGSITVPYPGGSGGQYGGEGNFQITFLSDSSV